MADTSRTLKAHPDGQRRTRLSALGFLAFGLVPLLAYSAAFAQAEPKLLPPDHAQVRAAAGGWDIEAPNGRKCRVQLNPKGTRADLVVGVPVPCKMSLPALVPAALWGLGEDGTLLLRSMDGKSIAQFRRDGTGAMKGRLGADELTFTPASGRYPDAAKQAAIISATSPLKAGAAPASAAKAAFRTTPPPPAEALPGAYAVMRNPGKEVCQITLEAKPAAKPGQNLAILRKGCSDSGLVIFDPVGWRFDGNQLFLVARKGHETSFVHGEGGIWRKDPPRGAALMLGKSTP